MSWGDGSSWEERNWDSVRRQEQKKQEILIKASKNSERTRQLVRQVEDTRKMGAETLGELDKQSGSPSARTTISFLLLVLSLVAEPGPDLSVFFGDLWQ